MRSRFPQLFSKENTATENINAALWYVMHPVPKLFRKNKNKSHMEHLTCLIKYRKRYAEIQFLFFYFQHDV